MDLKFPNHFLSNSDGGKTTETLEKNRNTTSVQFSHSVMSDSATPWTAACQAFLSITNSQSLLKPMSIESVMPSNHLILCCPLLLLPLIFPSLRVFSNEYQLFESGGKSTGVSASTSVFPMNTQDWSALGWTGWISFQSKWLSTYSLCWKYSKWKTNSFFFPWL